ncbi:MAG: SH3 domain-containing protein [Desulfobacteraceae bacterium]|nr:SH3 domain-containing protein [Desulfobacteraceae bacterium]
MKRILWLSGFLIWITLSTSFAAERMTVMVDKANVRSGPGNNYDVIWMVEKYHPVLIVKTSGEWYRFRDFEGDEAWIHKSLLGKTPAVIVIKDNINVRSGPGTNHPVLFTVERGIPFKVIERKSPWVHLEHADGDKGWIHQALLW